MIKNLLFDLGGVVMDIRRENCVEAFRKLGMADPDRYLGDYSQSGPFAGIENGSLSVEQFHDAIRSIMGRPDLPAELIDHAFEQFLIGIPRRRLEALRSLHSRFHLYVLSNTNPIMWNGFISKEFTQEGHDVNHYFDGIVRSYKAGCMKPDPRIFTFTAAHLGIKPEETLFLDDSQRNLDAAATLGYHILLVPPGSEFIDLLKQYPGLDL